MAWFTMPGFTIPGHADLIGTPFGTPAEGTRVGAAATVGIPAAAIIVGHPPGTIVAAIGSAAMPPAPATVGPAGEVAAMCTPTGIAGFVAVAGTVIPAPPPMPLSFVIL
eukprot:s225_g8.t1